MASATGSLLFPTVGCGQLGDYLLGVVAALWVGWLGLPAAANVPMTRSANHDPLDNYHKTLSIGSGGTTIALPQSKPGSRSIAH